MAIFPTSLLINNSGIQVIKYIIFCDASCHAEERYNEGVKLMLFIVRYILSVNISKCKYI